jgi:hypothetical protein
MSLINPNQPTPQPINNVLATANPTLYAASLAGQPTQEERAIQENIQRLLNKDRELTRINDAGKAWQAYSKLEPEIKQGLMFINEGAAYQKAPPSVLGTIGKVLLNTATEPFRMVFDVAEFYYKAINLPYKLTSNLLDDSKPTSGDFKKFLTTRTWSDAWDGHNQWDSKMLKELEIKHGKAKSYLIRGLIDGKKPGDILREYGPLDTPMVDAVRNMSENGSDWKTAFGEHKAGQVNPGNDFTNWLNSDHPPQEGNLWAIVPLTIASLSGTSDSDSYRAFQKSKEIDSWVVENPNPWAKGEDKYVSPSGTINFVYQIAVDPLTWLTGGSSKAVLKSEKLAETFVNAGKNNSTTRVIDLFADPQVASLHDGLAKEIVALRTARKAGNDAESGIVRMRIARDYPKYDNEGVLDLLVKTKVLDDQERLVPITDLPTMIKFFEQGEYMNYIISGRVEGLHYYTENHVAIERSTRKITTGIKETFDQIFNGVGRRVAAGKDPIPEEVLESAKAFDRYFANRPEFQLIDPKLDEVIQTLTVSGNRFQRAYNSAMSGHPPNVMIYTEDGMVVKSAGAFRDFARVIVGDKTRANLLTERFLRVTPEERINMLFSMFKLYTDKLGLSSTVKGLDVQRAWLESIFAPIKGMGPISDIQMPRHLISDGMIDVPTGPSQILHTTDGISMPDFNIIAEWIHSNVTLNAGFRRHFGIGELTNAAWARFLMNGWTKLTLYPKLGLKSAVDEGTIAALVQQPRAIFAFMTGKGSSIANAVAAYRGSTETYGLVKSKLLSISGRNPAEYVSPAMRRAMQEPQMVDASYTLPNGKVIERQYLISADEYFGGTYEERLSAMVIAKYAGKLSEQEKRWLATHLMNNSHAVEGMVQSQVARSLGNTMVEGSVQAEMYGKSPLTEAVEEWGRKDMGTYLTDEKMMLTMSERTAVHYDGFYRYFGKNVYKTAHGQVIDFGSLFIKHNGLETAADGAAYVDEIMELIGWTKRPITPALPRLPEGYSFVSVAPNTGKGSYPAIDVMKDGKVAATLSWDPETNIIESIFVAVKDRKQGIAKALWAEARKANPSLKHSEYRTPEGDVFAHSVGGPVPKLKVMGTWTQKQIDAAEQRAVDAATKAPESAFTWSVVDRVLNPGTEYEKIITQEQLLTSIKRFNGRFGQTFGLRAAGKSAEQITDAIVRKSMGELYVVFHGSSEVYNRALIDAIRSRLEEAATKIKKRDDFYKSDEYLREYAGKPLVKTAETERARRAYEARMTSPSYHVGKMPYADFEVLVKDFPIQGMLKTQYDFPGLIDSAESAFKKFGEIPWKQMDRQLTDLYRADAFSIKVMEQRSKMQPDEMQMVKDLVKNGVDPDAARLQADLYFDSRATHNAADELMKYADNPDVRTQMAWNLRGVGRFYRASEDYIRRYARYLTAHPDKVIYRAGHLSQAMSGSGVVYTDDKGNQYVMIPNDGIIWGYVAPALTALTDPVKAAVNIKNGNWDFFKQPQWNQYSSKISLLNPSYNDAAGVPSLTGPTIAIPALVVKALFNVIGRELDSEPVLKFADNIDNIVLGPGSDNTTWVRAAVPVMLTNLWAQFDPEHKTAIQATTLMQAAANIEVSGNTKMEPEDWENAEKVQQYYDRLGIATHNLIATKIGFNTLVPTMLSTNDPDIPPELRKVGILSFRQEFSDILRAVLDVNSKYGYYMDDPIATAVSMFTASNPDKLIYTVGANNKAAKAAISYTKETKLWTMRNTEVLRDYPDVAWVFAPNIGKYDPSVVKYLEAADIIPGKTNPFNDNGGVLKRYLLDIATVRARNDFYNVDRQVQILFNDPNNPERNRASYRAEVLRQARDIKFGMKQANPALALQLGTNPVIPRQELITRFNHLDQMVNNPKYFDKLPKGQRLQMAQMTALTNRMLIVLEDTNIRSQFNGEETVNKVRDEGLEYLKNFAAGNAPLTEAYQSIIKPLIDDVYTTPTVAMGKG